MKIAVVTVGRSDYGLYRPVLRALETAAHEVELWVASAHLSPHFGRTVQEIEADGFAIGARIHSLLSSDEPASIAKSMAVGLLGFAEQLECNPPDLLMVLGDRFDMYVAAVAALPFRIPVAHIHGGELTFGAIDDALRHSMTKLSHLHFVSAEPHRERVIQLGEDPDRVFTVGAPALDATASFAPMTRDELRRTFHERWPDRYLLVTLHPETLADIAPADQISRMTSALCVTDADVVFTMPNADAGGALLREGVHAWLSEHPDSIAVESLGQVGFWSAMKHAEAMVGNSSSGLIEAPSFGVPVVNIGSRQAGRVRAANVIDVAFDSASIADGIARATSDGFRARLSTTNPYYAGGAAGRIVEILNGLDDPGALCGNKRFVDLPRMRLS